MRLEAKEKAVENSKVTLEEIPALSDEELAEYLEWVEENKEHAFYSIFPEPDEDGYQVHSCGEGGVADRCFICAAESELRRREMARERAKPGGSALSVPFFNGLCKVKEMELGYETYYSLGGFHGEMARFTVALREKKPLEEGYYLLTWGMVNMDALDGSTPGESFTTKEFTVALPGDAKFTVSGQL